MERKLATTLGLKIPLFKKSRVDLQSLYSTEYVYLKGNTHSHTYFLNIKRSFILWQVSVWVHFRSKTAFYSPSCLLVLDAKKADYLYIIYK